MNIEELRQRVDDADVPYRELGSLSGVIYSRICNAFRGWVTLKDKELAAIEKALNLALRNRVEKYNRLLAASTGVRQGVSA